MNIPAHFVSATNLFGHAQNLLDVLVLQKIESYSKRILAAFRLQNTLFSQNFKKHHY